MRSFKLMRYPRGYLLTIARQSIQTANANNAIFPKSLSTVTRDGNAHQYNNIIIIGGGIAGLSTARYLLQHSNNLHVTIIDKNEGMPTSKTQYTSHDQQLVDLLHYNVPSRRNGNVLCPSLTVPWTSRSLWSEVFLPMLTSYFGGGKGSSSPAVLFDQSLVLDRNMWSFAYHFLSQKFIHANPKHQTNKPILGYSMKCLDDPSDALIQRIDYGRCAQGTQLLDGNIVSSDSSGDIGLFCQGLINELKSEYVDCLNVAHGEETTAIEQKDGLVRGATSLDPNGNTKTREADAIVIACGNASTTLCNSLKVPCPIFPVKGHLATVASTTKCEYNITLPGGVGYAAPMAIKDAQGRCLYRLSGFVDFTLNPEVNFDRIEALVDATRIHLADLELVDASACFRPISADDRPIVGVSERYSNLFLCTGLGSRGWSVGLGCGKLLSRDILGLPCEIDPAPYSPKRFG